MYRSGHGGAMLPDTPYISVSTILLESKYSEWLEGMNKQNYSAIEELIIGTPIEQNINALGQKSGGRFETRNMQKPTMQVSEFRALTETEDGFQLKITDVIH